jgi:hypothetical protein
VQAWQQVADEAPAILDGAHAVGAAIVGSAIAISLSHPDWSQLGTPGSNGSMTLIPDQVMHPGAYVPTEAPALAVGKVNAPTATELPYPIAGRVDLPAKTPAPENYVFAKGRNGKQAKLKDIANDPKESSTDRGWIKQDQNAVARGNRTTLRVPPGKNLAHERGKEVAKGYGYKDSKLNTVELHKLQQSTEKVKKKQ